MALSLLSLLRPISLPRRVLAARELCGLCPPTPPAKYLGENRHPGLVPTGVLLSRWYFAGAPGPTGRKAGGGNWE